MSIISYAARAKWYVGQVAYNSVRGFVHSRAAETAAVTFGRVVCAGTNDKQCVMGGTTAVLGVALRDHVQGMDEDSVGQYEIGANVSIIDKDIVILETASTSGTYGQGVYFDTAASTGVVVITSTPTATQKLIGYLKETVTAAGKIKVWVDSDLSKADAPPQEVTALALTAGDTQLVAAWTDPTDTDLSYLLVTTYPTATGVIVDTRIVAAAAETTTITGLTNGTEYTVKVQAVDTTGNMSVGSTAAETPAA